MVFSKAAFATVAVLALAGSASASLDPALDRMFSRAHRLLLEEHSESGSGCREIFHVPEGQTLNCVPNGGTCDPEGVDECTGAVFATCDNTTHTCVKEPGMADVYNTACDPSKADSCLTAEYSPLSCVTLNDEGRSLRAAADTGRCLFQHAEAGAVCTLDVECASGHCNIVGAATSGVCSGVEEGETCYNGGCAGGLYCDRAHHPPRCTKKGGLGEHCLAYDETCVAPFICSGGPQSTCVEIGSLPNGAVVDNLASCRSGFGRLVNSSLQCAPRPPPSAYGAPCNGPRDGLSCVCPLGTPAGGEGVLFGGASADLTGAKQLAQCAASHPVCPYRSLITAYGATPASCLYYSCHKSSQTLRCDMTLQNINAVVKGLNLPDCFVQYFHSHFGSLQSCLDWTYVCARLPDGAQVCHNN